MRALNIACGDRLATDVSHEFTNIDFTPVNNEVKKVNLLKPLPYDDNSFDFIYCSHFLEHLDRGNALSFLKEVRRVLKKGGIFRAVVPDLEEMVHEYIAALEGVRGDALGLNEDAWSLNENGGALKENRFNENSTTLNENASALNENRFNEDGGVLKENRFNKDRVVLNENRLNENSTSLDKSHKNKKTNPNAMAISPTTRHEWIALEMFDQMTRTVRGGGAFRSL